MKARTTRQKHVEELHNTLRELSSRNLEWAKRKFFDKHIYVMGERCWCSECGYVWRDSAVATTSSHTCPKCNVKRYVRKSQKRREASRYYFTTLSTCRGWQVVRHYLICRTALIDRPAYYDVDEVVQIWIDELGRELVMARPRRGLCGYYDAWIPHAPMAIRIRPTYGPDPFDINAPVAPGGEVTLRLKRNGYRRDCTRRSADTMMKGLLLRPKIETLIKAREYALADHFVEMGDAVIEKYWPSMKIAMRNGYKVTDAGLWRDMIDALISLCKDVHNPRYVCPPRLKEAHDMYIERRRRVEMKEAARKVAEEQQEASARYKERWGKMLSLCLQLGNIQARPLQDVLEFYEEGEAMAHCVYTNCYYDKDDSLVFTVIDRGGRRIATVEYDVSRARVLQCRGRANSKPDRYKDIMRLFEANALTIARNRENGNIAR